MKEKALMTAPFNIAQSQTSVQPSASQDETAIRHLFQNLIISWNKGDAQAYAAQFTEDSDYIAFDGSHFKGRKANADNHQKLFDSFLKGSTLEGQGITDLRFLSPEVALLHMIGTVKLKWQKKPAPGRLSIQTLVAVKQDGEWKFAAFHNSRIQKRTWLETLLLMLGRK
jgi:uncharacterized protein (TIGR02246 family)